MIGELKPYSDYKESGLPWLGGVPAHWRLDRAKSIFRCVDLRSKTGNEELLTVSSASGVVPRRTAVVTMFKAESYVGHKLCWPGDLVVNSLWAWAGGLGVSDYHGIISTAYSVYRIRPGAPMSSAFVHQVMRSLPFSWELHVRSKGIWISRLQLTDVSFLEAPMFIPPLEEQAAIVRFLDWANGRLERAIRAKRKVIKLLNEQKQVIIHQAVTRGLDPTVPLKPSGIPWLGDIPAHWKVSRIKNELLNLNRSRIPLDADVRGRMTTKIYDYYGASGIIDKVDDFIFDDELLLIAEDGANLVLRNLPLCIIAKGKFWVNNHAHILKPKRCNLVFMAQFLETLNYMPWISGAAQPKLTKDRLMSISISIAPADEQFDIVEYINVMTDPLNIVISNLTREIKLLQEYRTRLVSDVVTGKLDVREAAASLSVEIAESEPLDDLAQAEEDLDIEDEVDGDSEEAEG